MPAPASTLAGQDPQMGGEQRDGLTDLLRNAHIFASAVRDVLEVRLLRRVTADPLTLSQFSLLKLISRNGHHQVGDVARLLGISAPAATKNVDKLEQLGLLKRERCTDDRRATLLAPSDKGRQLVATYEDAKEERLAPVLAEFTALEMRQLAALLDRLSVRLLTGEVRPDRLCMRCSGYYIEDCSIQRLGVRCPYAPDERAGRVA